jgi:hypothetical protein
MFQHPNDPVTAADANANADADAVGGGDRDNTLSSSFYHSRGKLPGDCGDAGCIAVRNRDTVAVAVEGGEILLLAPTVLVVV